jgi:hypothetical protein
MSTEISASKGRFVVQLEYVIVGVSRGKKVKEHVPKEGTVKTQGMGGELNREN